MSPGCPQIPYPVLGPRTEGILFSDQGQKATSLYLPQERIGLSAAQVESGCVLETAILSAVTSSGDAGDLSLAACASHDRR